MSAHTIASPIGSTSVVEPETTDSAASSDAELLSRARRGDDSAFATLWRRHLPAAYAVAMRFRGRVAPEDLVAEASARILRLLREGGGPTDNFRSYFASTVRTVGVDAVRREMNIVPTEDPDLEMLVDPEPDVSALAGGGVDTDIVRAAFRLLGDGDQQLLWHTMVEGSAPRVVAPLLGVSANAVSARAMRAREALRSSYLDVWVQRRVPACGAPECRWTLDHLGGFVRGRLTSRQRARAAAHLEECPRDACLAGELQHVYDRFGALTGPLVLIAGAAVVGNLGHGTMAGLVSSAAAGTTVAGTAAAGATAVGTATVSATAASATAGATAGVGATASAAGAASSGVVTGIGAATTGAPPRPPWRPPRPPWRPPRPPWRPPRPPWRHHRDRRHGRDRHRDCGVALPVAAGVAGSAVLTSGAVAGGSILAGSTLGPPLATAFAGLVVGMGVAVAPAAAQQLPPPAPAAVVVTAGPAVAPAPAAPAHARIGIGSGRTGGCRTGSRRTCPCSARTGTVPDRPLAAHRPHPGPAWWGTAVASPAALPAPVDTTASTGTGSTAVQPAATTARDDRPGPRPTGLRPTGTTDRRPATRRPTADRRPTTTDPTTVVGATGAASGSTPAAENDVSVTTPATTPSPVPVPPAPVPAAAVDPAPPLPLHRTPLRLTPRR